MAASDELAKLLARITVAPNDQQDGVASTSGSDIDWEQTGHLAQRCADSLRTEHARTHVGAQQDLVKAVAFLLEASVNVDSQDVQQESTRSNAQTQLCRVVGNLVLDHPSNRTRCVEHQIPQKILRVLKQLHESSQADAPLCSDKLQTIKACTGALLNLSIDTPEIASSLVQASALDILAHSVALYRMSSWAQLDGTPSSEFQLRQALVDWSIKLIAELVTDETVHTPPSLASALAQLILSLPYASTTPPSMDSSPEARQLLEADLSILAGASELLETQAYNSEAIQEALVLGLTPSLLIQMLDFVEKAEVPSAWSAIPSAENEEDDDLEVDKTLSNVKASIARTAIAAVGSDKVMDETFKPNSELVWLLNRCLAWLNGRPDLIITSTTILANLARKDAYCIALVHDYSISPILAKLLDTYASPSPSTSSSLTRPGEATQILHGVTGLLKNLSIPGGNKQTLCDADVIPSLTLLLRPTLDMVLPLQNAAIGTIKHLCAGNVSSALEVVLPQRTANSSQVVTVATEANGTSETSLQAVLALIARTDDVRLKCEATRLLGNVVRSLFSSRSVTSPVTPSALHGLEMGLAKKKARHILETSAETVEALSELLRTGEKYPSLVNEAIVALTLLSTTRPGALLTVEAITNPHEVHTPPADGIANGTLSNPLERLRAGEANKGSRQNSLMTRFAPATAADIIIRWLNEYAIESAAMPAEMAGNAVACIDTIVRSLPEVPVKSKLPLQQLKVSLSAVGRRNAAGPHEQALKTTAERLLESL